MPHEISARQLAAKLEAGEPVYLLDVRQREEHALAAISGDTLIPLNELAARAAEVQPPDGALLVIYCHHGIRSRHAAMFLEQQGHPEVASLAGGIEAWSLEVDPNVPRY